MYKKNRLKLLVLIVLVIGVNSCNSNRVFYENHTFSNYHWPVEEKLVFKPKINAEQQGKEYQLRFSIRYIQGFPYKYLNLLITITRPDGTQAEKEESIQIREDNADYIGDGAGSYWDLDYTIEDSFKFNQAGEYLIEIVPISEESKVYYINELALEITSITQ